MSAIASTDVSYAEQGQGKTGPNSRRQGTFKISFGDGALTYPAGGIPLIKGNLACPTQIEEFNWVEDASSNGFVYKFDFANQKIRIYQGDNTNVAAAPLVELGSVAIAATNLYANVLGW